MLLACPVEGRTMPRCEGCLSPLAKGPGASFLAGEAPCFLSVVHEPGPMGANADYIGSHQLYVYTCTSASNQLARTVVLYALL